MGKGENIDSPKPEKTPPPAQQEQPIMTQPYPDWAAMQAYYGSGVPMPPPYFNTTVAPGHPPYPYMWGPQPLVSPFASPFSLYPYGIPPNPSASSPVVDVPTKSPDSKDKGLMKKLKGFNGLAVSTGTINGEIKVGDESVHSRSEENGVEGSSAASDENNESRGKENQRKRSSEDSLTSGDKTSVAPIIPKVVPMYTLPTPNQMKVEVHPEAWTQDERELKRERRKQSNRESARRSRLRKQAETEELAIKVETIGSENTTLRNELNQLKQSLECLKAENSLLLEKLKDVQFNSDNKFEEDGPTIVVENFLSRIDENQNHQNSNSDGNPKLHQLLDSKPRTDAMVAG